MSLASARPRIRCRQRAIARGPRRTEWKTLYGHEFLYGGPLFMHQLSHLWIDFRGIQDEYMRAKGIDYFENSRRATYVQQAYAIRNPKRFTGYGEHMWGISASNGPGPATRRVNGVARRFLGYRARACRTGPTTGRSRRGRWWRRCRSPRKSSCRAFSIAWTAIPQAANEHGLVCSINPTFPGSPRRRGLDFARAFRARSGSGCPDD